MKRFCIILFLFIACACQAQDIGIASGGSIWITGPSVNTTAVDATTTISLFHYDTTSFLDTAGILDWSLATNTNTFANVGSEPAKFDFGLYDATGLSSSNWSLTATATAEIASLTDFTLEFWLRVNDVGAHSMDTLYKLFFFKFIGTSDLEIYFSYIEQTVGGENIYFAASSLTSLQPLVDGNWVHVAIDSYGATGTLFINGSAASIADLSSYDFSTVTQLQYGRADFSLGLGTNWVMDDLRISNYSVYQATAFTPPTKPFGREYSPALVLTKPVSPPVEGYEGWFDASDESTILDVAGAVASWTDKSANAYGFTTISNTIKTGAETINGLNTISFYNTPTNYIGIEGSAGPTPLGSSSYTIFIVFEVSSSAVNTMHNFVFAGAAATNQALIFDTFTTGSNWSLRQEWYLNSYSMTAAGTPTASPSIFTYVYDDSTGSQTTRLNQYEESRSGATGKNTSSARFWIGSDGTYACTGNLGEIIIYHSTLTPAEILSVETYLKNKWGI